ncbi:hypothetical protein EVAR_3202_1 [Eumeta japonica]|uniref:Uncharacterized protein n=1 Tax=Eumeta variegata TaxID=151549 RepID=A0A4C1SUR0_EUMVA|nr:hypothetical protein EVAR_3202_1 [Eumeta japonica]
MDIKDERILSTSMAVKLLALTVRVSHRKVKAEERLPGQLIEGLNRVGSCGNDRCVSNVMANGTDGLVCALRGTKLAL